MFIEPETTNDIALLLALRNEATGFKIWSIASNFFFLIPLAISLRYRIYLVSWPIAAAFLVSLYYHTCLAFDVCGGLPWTTIRAMDHLTAPFVIFAFLSIYVATHDDNATDDDLVSQLEDNELALARDNGDELNTDDVNALDLAQNGDLGAPLAPPRGLYNLTALWPAFVLTVTALAGLALPFSMFTSWATVMAMLMSIVLYEGLFRVERHVVIGRHGWQIHPRSLHFPILGVGVLLAAVALFCFLYAPPGGNTNDFLHSCWHVFGQLALVAFLLAKEWRAPPRPKRLNLHQPEFSVAQESFDLLHSSVQYRKSVLLSSDTQT
jgi:hypothetical protein